MLWLFKLFGLFRDRPPTDPPTEKQRRYAAKLRIVVTPTMTKSELSEEIAAAERREPGLVEEREQVKVKAKERKFGAELVEEERRWNQFADDGGYILAVYVHRKETVVDVLRVAEAFIDGRGKLRLSVDAPKLMKDRYIGEHLDWDRHFELPITSLLYHEPLDPEFYIHDAQGYGQGNRAYRAIVERGLKIAERL